MVLNIEKSGEQDQGHSEEWFKLKAFAENEMNLIEKL